MLVIVAFRLPNAGGQLGTVVGTVQNPNIFYKAFIIRHLAMMGTMGTPFSHNYAINESPILFIYIIKYINM